MLLPYRPKPKNPNEKLLATNGAREQVLRQPELLALIVGHLRAHSTLSDIHRCLQVSKLWYTISLECLYSNVVLDRLNAFDFFKYPEIVKHWHLIRTLSVTFKRGTCSEVAVKEIPEESFPAGRPIGRRELSNESVSHLAKAVQQMPRLRSFSIRRHAAGAHMHEDGFTFAQTMLENIVESLPESCVHVEIDTSGDDHGTSLEQKYLAKAISRILPRLLSLRLRLSTAMSSFYSTIFVSETTDELISAPHLKSLVLSYFAAVGVVGVDDSKYEMLVTRLESFAMENPQIERGCLLSLINSPLTPDMCAPGVHWFQYMDAFYVHDIKTKTSVAFPSTPVSGLSALLRIHNGEDLICRQGTLWEIAEDVFWHSSLQGDRLPASLDSVETRLTKSELLHFNRIRTGTKEDFQERYNDSACVLWVNESHARKPLIEPQQRTDHARAYVYWKKPKGIFLLS